MAEYDSKEGGMNQWNVPSLFLEVLPEEVPEALKELADQPFILFQQIEFDGYKFSPLIIQHSHFIYSVLCSIEEVQNKDPRNNNYYTPSFRAFHRSFHSWARKYHLEEKWLLENFVSLLVDWL